MKQQIKTTVTPYNKQKLVARITELRKDGNRTSNMVDILNSEGMLSREGLKWTGPRLSSFMSASGVRNAVAINPAPDNYQYTWQDVLGVLLKMNIKPELKQKIISAVSAVTE